MLSNPFAFAERVAIVTAAAGLAATGLTAGPVAASAAASSTKYTLTVKATNLAGKPDTSGQIQISSVDENAPTSAVGFKNGVATLKLAAGHYFAVASFGPESSEAPVRYVVFPQINLARNQTLKVAEAEADSKVTMATPRPATAIDTDVQLLRTRASGPPITMELTGFGPVWFNTTTAKPTVGTFRMSVNQHLESPAGTAVPYEYTLNYIDPPGILPPQHYVASAKDLATVHERIYQPVHSTGSWALGGSLPGTYANNGRDWFGFVEPDGPSLTLPGQLTEYAEGPVAMQWSGQYEPLPRSAFLVSGARLLHPGENLTENWSAYPLHTAANVLLESEPDMFGATLPSASRQGNTLTLDVDPFDDNQPGHEIGWLGSTSAAKVTGTYQVAENGTKIAGGSAVSKIPNPDGEFYTKATLNPAKASTIRFSLHVTRTGADYPLSNAISTVWTWHTAPPAATAKVPAGWTCVQYKRVSNCAIQPMMTLRYAVAGLSLHGTVKAGRQVLHVSVAHLQAAKATAITHAAVSVSFDGGKTWHPARVSGHDGQYTAVFSAAAGTKVTLRTRATDAAGGSITETIANGYQIA